MRGAVGRSEAVVSPFHIKPLVPQLRSDPPSPGNASLLLKLEQPRKLFVFVSRHWRGVLIGLLARPTNQQGLANVTARPGTASRRARSARNTHCQRKTDTAPSREHRDVLSTEGDSAGLLP
jgi:hypothetical protein